MTSIADIYVVTVERDYGADDDFTFDTAAEARACYDRHVGQPDVRRVYLDGPDAADSWSLT